MFNFLRDDSPWSTMRVATFLTIALFVPTFVAAWGYLSFKIGQLQVIPDSVMWLLGVLLGAKVAQKAVEAVQGIFTPPPPQS
jgi:hypothetical protein